MKEHDVEVEDSDEFEAKSEQQLSSDLNAVRMERTSFLTRGLELPKDSTTRARVSFYNHRDNCVKQCIALNYTDTEITNVLKISGTMLAKIKMRIFKNEIESLQGTTQLHHFVEYKLRQTEVAKDLDVLIERYRNGGNLQGLSIALRVKLEVLRDLWKAAQDIGLLDKKPDRVIYVDGQNTKEMTTEELVASLEEGYQRIQKITGSKLPNTKSPSHPRSN